MKQTIVAIVIAAVAIIAGASVYDYGYQHGYQAGRQLTVKDAKINNTWERYDPDSGTYRRLLQFNVGNTDEVFKVTSKGRGTISVVKQNQWNDGFYLQVTASPQHKTLVDIWVSDGKGTTYYPWSDTTPGLPAHLTPPQVFLQVEKLDDPYLNDLYRVTATLGPGEDPSTMYAELGWANRITWGKPTVTQRYCGKNPTEHRITIVADDQADPLRPEGKASQPIS